MSTSLQHALQQLCAVEQAYEPNPHPRDPKDAHVWLESDTGQVLDPTPIPDLYPFFRTDLGIKLVPFPLKDQAKLAAAFAGAEKGRIKQLNDTDGWGQFVERPQPSQCWLNCIAVKKQAPTEWKLVIGSLGFVQPDKTLQFEYG